jgi:hypothetical protein
MPCHKKRPCLSGELGCSYRLLSKKKNIITSSSTKQQLCSTLCLGLSSQNCWLYKLRCCPELKMRATFFVPRIGMRHRVEIILSVLNFFKHSTELGQPRDTLVCLCLIELCLKLARLQEIYVSKKRRAHIFFLRHRCINLL